MTLLQKLTMCATIVAFFGSFFIGLIFGADGFMWSFASSGIFLAMFCCTVVWEAL